MIISFIGSALQIAILAAITIFVYESLHLRKAALAAWAWAVRLVQKLGI